MHQCYYCEQIFDSKEDLFEHVEVHSDVERNREITNRKKKAQKSQQNLEWHSKPSQISFVTKKNRVNKWKFHIHDMK